MRLAITTIVILIPFFVFAEEPLQTINVDDIRVIKISEAQAMAVIKTPAKKLQMVKVGDNIGDRGKVTEIAKGRIVIEETTDKGIITIIIRFENREQTIERISKMNDAPAQYFMPGAGDRANNQKTE